MSKPKTAGSTDDYAASYMSGTGRVLLRDKVVGRVSLLLLGFAALWCGGGAVASFADLLPKASFGAGVFLVFMTAFFGFLAATLTIVRTVVSEGEVLVQYGLWGPRVPIGRVLGARVVPYDWKRFGGWGIKRDGEGTRAYVMSARGDVVELRYADEKGDERKAQFSASDPAGVVAAIEQARAGRSRARVAEAGTRASDELAGEKAGEAELEAEEPDAEADQPSGGETLMISAIERRNARRARRSRR